MGDRAPVGRGHGVRRAPAFMDRTQDFQSQAVRTGLPAGGRWIRTFSSGASGEADAILPVKDRPREGGSAPPGKLETRLKKLIEIHRALGCKGSPPFNVSRLSAAFTRTRPPPPVIYSALFLASSKGSSNEADSG